MKKYFILALLLTTPAFAGNMPTDAQMQEAMKQMEAMQKKHGMKAPAFDPKMMEAAQGMSRCMEEKVSKDGMKHLEEKGKKNAQAIEALCKEGKKDEALKLAMEFGKDMQKDKDVQAMRGCSEKYKDAFKNPAANQYRQYMEHSKPKKEKDICG